jgi:drug/metabolite transporter (DMT)-like permease
MIVSIALLLALGASFCENYSTYMQKKAMDTLPTLSFRLSWTVIRAWITNRPWLSAVVMECVGVALYMLALIRLPVSIVEPIITAGIALVAYLAIKKLGEKPNRLDFIAMGTIVVGVIFLAVSLTGGVHKHNTYMPKFLWPAVIAVVILAIAIPLGLSLFRRNSLAAGLGCAGGLVFGLSAVFSRLLMGDSGNLWYIWLLACAVTYPLGFVLFQSGLQRGRAVVIAPIYNAMMLGVPILIGTLAMDEHLPANDALAVLRIISFVLIVCGSIVLARSTADVVHAPELSEEPQLVGAS